MAPDSAQQLRLSENRKPREQKTEKNREKEEQAGKPRSSVARAPNRSFEGRRGARALHGCDRRFPGSKTRIFRRRLPAYEMAAIGARPDCAMGHSGIQPRRKACLAGLSRELLAEDAWTAGRSCLGEERARIPARSAGNDQAGEKPENRFVLGDSARTGPDDSPRGAGAGRSQLVSSGSVGGLAAGAGCLAAIVNSRESPTGINLRVSASIRRFVFLLLPG